MSPGMFSAMPGRSAQNGTSRLNPTQARPLATAAERPGWPKIVVPTNTPPSVLTVTPTGDCCVGELGLVWAARDGMAVPTTAVPTAAAMARRRIGKLLGADLRDGRWRPLRR